MTVRMPHDTVDSEVYIKTPRGHSRIQMDPWMASTWKRNWTTQYTPNKVTKDKLARYRHEKTQDTSVYTRQQEDTRLKVADTGPPDQMEGTTFQLTTPQSGNVSSTRSEIETAPAWRGHPKGGH